MNLFFIVILVTLGTRTVYYMLLHFNFEEGLVDKPVDNQYLVVLYLQEIIFDFIVLYNLVLKQGHEEKHFENQYRRTTTFHRNRRGNSNRQEESQYSITE